MLSLDDAAVCSVSSDVPRVSLAPNIIRFRNLSLKKWINRSNSVNRVPDKKGIMAIIRHLLNVLIGDSSEPTFPVKVSLLVKNINYFCPDVIYTTLGSYAVNRIVIQLSYRLNIPVVSHVMDDWIMAKNNYGLISYLHGNMVRNAFHTIMNISRVRFAISHGMKEEYCKRYNVNFIVLSNFVDVGYFNERSNYFSSSSSGMKGDMLKIGYVGTVSRNSQKRAISDVLDAIDEFNLCSPIKACLYLYVTHASLDYALSCFSNRINVRVRSAPDDDYKYFSILTMFDMLLMPSSFSGPAFKYIKYSVPAKLPSYLMSGRPVFFYGSPQSEQIKIAKNNNLGYVVDERRLDSIVGVINQYISDRSCVNDIVSTQFEFADKYYNSERSRISFFKTLDEVLA